MSRASSLYFSVKYLEVIRSVLTLVSYSGMTLPSDEVRVQTSIEVVIAHTDLSPEVCSFVYLAGGHTNSSLTP